LAIVKAVSNIEFSSVFLPELKSVAVGKKNVLAASNANATSASSLHRQSSVGNGALTSCNSAQLPVSIRKSEEISSSDCPFEPASRHHAPGHLFVTDPRPRPADEPAAQNSRQLGSTEGGLAYAALVAWGAVLQQPSGPQKPLAHSCHHSLSETCPGLSGMPDDKILSAQVVINHVTYASKRRNKTPLYVSGVMDTRGFLSWRRASCQRWALSPD